MTTWIAIAGLGALGGLIGTLLPTGTDQPFSSSLQNILGSKPVENLMVHLLINIVTGGVAAFLLWALLDASATNLASTGITPRQGGTSLVIGFGGIAAIKKFYQQILDAANWKDAAKQATQAAMKLSQKAQIG